MSYFKDGYGSPEVYYQDFYSQSRGCTSTFFLKYLAAYPHKLMEKRYDSNEGKKILELGFGRGEHLEFVKANFDRYIGVDLRMFKEVYNISSSNFQFIKADAEKLTFQDSVFDRVIVTCLLAHLSNPERALLEWRRVIKKEGALTIYLPAEPGIAIKIFRKFISKRWASRNGFEGYDLFMAREHRNSFDNLRVLINEIFAGSSIVYKLRPLPKLGWYLNLFAIVEIKVHK